MGAFLSEGYTTTFCVWKCYEYKVEKGRSAKRKRKRERERERERRRKR